MATAVRGALLACLSAGASAVGAETELPSLEAPTWRAEIGILPIYWPVYEGADEFESVAFPYFHIEYGERFFLDFSDGLGAKLVDTDRVGLSAGITYVPGREESDSDVLRGLGSIEDGAAIRLAGELRAARYSFGATVVDQVSGENTGFVVDLEAAYQEVLANRYVLRPALIASITDDRYARSYFGVDAAQAVESEFAPYRPDAGPKSVGVQTDVLYLLSSTWSFMGQIKIERLLGDVADSPLVMDDDQYSIALGVAYRL